MLIVDNPVVSTLAEAGALTAAEDTKLDTSGVEPYLLAAGQLKGKTHGVPIGANTLALYYNKTVLTKAGVDPAQIKDWTSLTAALGKVKTSARRASPSPVSVQRKAVSSSCPGSGVPARN
jgi:multiple sugar transport system substrate-binding protein